MTGFARLAHAAALILLSAAQAQSPAAFTPYSSAKGRFHCEIPQGLSPEESSEAGVLYTRLSPEYLTSIDIDVHPVARLKRFARTPPGLSYAASLEQEGGASDFQILRPLKQGSFRGYPAWSITRQYTFALETLMPGSAPVATRDTYLVVQRPTDFVVISYKTRPSYFPDHLALLKHVLDTLQFSPEPFWETPRGMLLRTGLGLLAFLGAILVLFAALRRRPAQDPA